MGGTSNVFQFFNDPLWLDPHVPVERVRVKPPCLLMNGLRLDPHVPDEWVSVRPPCLLINGLGLEPHSPHGWVKVRALFS